MKMRLGTIYLEKPEEYAALAAKIRKNPVAYAQKVVKGTALNVQDVQGETIPVPTREDAEQLLRRLVRDAYKGSLGDGIFYTFGKKKFFAGWQRDFRKAKSVALIALVAVPDRMPRTAEPSDEWVAEWLDGFHEYLTAAVEAWNAYLQGAGE